MSEWREKMEAQLHRTLTQYLLNGGFRELAAAMVDGWVTILFNEYEPSGVSLDIPPAAHVFLSQNPELEQILIKAAETVSTAHIYEDQPERVPQIILRMKLLEVEEGWRDVIKDLIVNYKPANQGYVTELMSSKRNQEVITYNEMKFASQSEIRIAQEFERRRVLFFPLPLAVRTDTGRVYQDHREPDFVVCVDGVWGILEVSYHQDRYEKDKEKDAWFKNAGILCVEHYTAERCFNQPREVVAEFLGILAKHKR